ncbi:MAG: ABC-2 transporter permease [Syntrophomonadaceae bacterium]|nr:ABC-2 transporter permease [Syntrophomonadaceae bacterium]
MLNLLRKDILVQKHTLWFALGYCVLVFFAFSNEAFGPFTYFMGAVGASYVLILSAVQAELKNDSDLVLLSLPVKRQEVVVSKYLAILVFTLLSLAAMGITGLILVQTPLAFPGRLINWQDAAITLVSIALLTSIYLPAFYKFRGKWLQVINIVLFMTVFFAPSTIIRYLHEHRQEQGVQWLLQAITGSPDLAAGLGIAAVVGLMLISLLISVNIYQKQDF